MTRVFHRAGSAYASRARSKPPTKVRRHKIIMETVTQEKKKLRSVISFEAKAPPGYTFIPAGNPKFTTACKELCRKDGLKIFTVSTTPHQGMHGLSQQVHRIGYHFPSVVVATVCMERGVFLSSTGKVMPYQQLPSHGNTRHFMRERRADSELSQNTINTEARDAIKDLFPNIPDKDLNQIIKTAFRKGKKKVGTAVELPLARRVQLAVVAHIRHVYTNYDRLLKLTSFQEARAAVEEPCLARLVQWRGDDENGQTVLEDVFREVIVISDDEDDDDISEEQEQGEEERDSSVEIVSSNTVVNELAPQPLRYGGPTASDRNNFPEPSEDEVPGVRFIPEHSRKRKSGNKKRLDRRGFSRYQAWDRARDRYRDTLNAANPTQLAEPSPQDGLPPSTQARLHGSKLTGHFAHAGEIPTRAQHIASPVDSPNVPKPTPYQGVESLRRQAYMRRPEPPRIIRLSDGTVFERADTLLRPNYLGSNDPPPLLGPSSTRTHGYLPTEQAKYHTINTPSYPSIPEGVNSVQEYVGRPTVRDRLPEDTGRGYAADHRLLLSRKRDSNGVSIDEAYQKQAPIDDLSGKVHVIDINDGRYQVPPKRGKIALRSATGSSRADDRREVPELYYSSAAGHDGNRLPEDYLPTPLGEREPILVNAADMRSDEHLYPSLSHTERSRPPLERRPMGDSPLMQATTRRDKFPDFFEHGQVRQVQVPGHVSHVSLAGHRPLSKPSVSTADHSSYRIRDDNNNVGPSQFSHVSRLPNVLVGPEAREGREVQFKRPDPAHSVAMRQGSPERRPILLDQDTRPSRIYSHDFVRPVQSPNKEKPSRYHPYHSLRDTSTQPKGRHSNHLPETNTGNLPLDHRVAYEPHPNRSLSPATQHSNTRIPVHGPIRTFHMSRPVQQPPPQNQRAYYTSLMVDPRHEVRPKERRQPQDEQEHPSPAHFEPILRREVPETMRPLPRHVVLR